MNFWSGECGYCAYFLGALNSMKFNKLVSSGIRLGNQSKGSGALMVMGVSRGR